MTFDGFVENSQAIFDGFPNEQIALHGGLKPNRQLQKPEAGYCIVLRYSENITGAISHFMTGIRTVLPPMLEYDGQNLHTTVGTCSKGELQGFIPNPALLQQLMKSVEKGIHNHPQNPCVEFGRWLYNDEAILISGYPNSDLWQLCQKIGAVCQENGLPLQMGRMLHITTARFIRGVTSQEFEQFCLLMRSAPAIETARPAGIDLATWCCDGLEFKLVTRKRYSL